MSVESDLLKLSQLREVNRRLGNLPSLRDQIAMAALTGLMAPSPILTTGGDENWEVRIAHNAYAVADAMLAEREKKP